MDTKMIQFNSYLGGFERINPEFAKVKIHILYEGINRNRSIFTRDTIEKMIPTLFNCPVVGEWIPENDNFGSHGGKIEISDKGIDFIDTTRPYGVIPSDSEITWEKIREKNGMTEHEYLTCTAFLWVGRYPELEKVINDGANQSMEIYPTKYHFDEDENMVVEDAYFSALCILGKDSDVSKNYEPCFESADIHRYSLDKEKFKFEFNALIQELKASLNNPVKEDETMDFDNQVEVPVEEVVETESADVVEEEKEEKEELVLTVNPVIEFSNKDTEIFNLKSDLEKKDTELFDLNTVLNTLKNDYEILQNEVKELREYKSENESKKVLVEKQEIFTKFAIALTDEEMKPVMEKVYELSVTEIKSELNDILATKNLSEISKKFNLEKKDVVMDIPKKDISKNKYAVV